jgi:hypothetical protein
MPRRMPFWAGSKGYRAIYFDQTARPNGLLVVSRLKQLWASNGDSTVKIIDLASQSPRE